ncbi:MAG: hypothetical protein JW816_00695 [Candidatus Buchananbacteria bacterium]|nr:hypothetical protein [Candidatus Buchananbacteria bacterium]
MTIRQKYQALVLLLLVFVIGAWGISVHKIKAKKDDAARTELADGKSDKKDDADGKSDKKDAADGKSDKKDDDSKSDSDADEKSANQLVDEAAAAQLRGGKIIMNFDVQPQFRLLESRTLYGYDVDHYRVRPSVQNSDKPMALSVAPAGKILHRLPLAPSQTAPTPTQAPSPTPVATQPPAQPTP